MAYAGICTTSLSASGFSVIWGFSGWVMGVLRTLVLISLISSNQIVKIKVLGYRLQLND
jgi:hypothetical protein